MHPAIARHDVSHICELLFSSAAEGLVVVDHQGTMLLTNPRMEELFGYAPGELIGQPIELLVPAAGRRTHAAHREQYIAHPTKRPMGIGLDLQGQRKDGSTFAVEVSLNHFELHGERFIMGLLTDITKRRAAETELQRVNAELEQRVEQRTAEVKAAEHNLREALEKEKELNALKSRFVSMASHEFRTPLSTILSSVDLIGRYNDGPHKANVERHVVKVRSKVRELTAMLNDLLSLEKLEQGQVQCIPEDLDLVDLCIELLEELRDLAKPGQEIRFDHHGAERRLYQDPRMLANVLRNLLTNAMKYSPEDRPIVLRTSIEGDQAVVQVIDLGIGIPAEDQPHLFQRFFRAGNAVTIQGTGLGLNIVRRYVDLMGGTIGFESHLNEGTTFTIHMPTRVSP
ncbi:MAG TPA: PAS domain-containing sensor histidine kinase [Flavobacteriales bacterium]|nr:PAS domain-containing sensor histidine kinase [Flavobacteriales bacterium]HMR26406.1 PAS domain-containing sensor histidine kinase [Flavobacteriales bacterium]